MRRQNAGVRRSYGVVWREGDLPVARGKLELLPTSLRLEGLAGERAVEREIRYDELSAVRVGRSSEDRLGGRRSLVLEPLSGARITVASVAQPGVVAELAERLAAVALDHDGVPAAEYVSFLPTPGPGDSEGGGVFDR